jgi:hypothetical protein
VALESNETRDDTVRQLWMADRLEALERWSVSGADEFLEDLRARVPVAVGLRICCRCSSMRGCRTGSSLLVVRTEAARCHSARTSQMWRPP